MGPDERDEHATARPSAAIKKGCRMPTVYALTARLTKPERRR
jgi:hypothetical protein